MRDIDLDRRGFLAAAATTPMLASAAEAGPAPVRSGANGGYDVVVIGAGVFGAWTAWTLRDQGAKVLLVDSWGPAHARASSGGETRLIRTEYRGDPLYTGWAWESLAAWIALSARHEYGLFLPTGALYIYPDERPTIARSLAVQRGLGIPVEQLPPAELARRWPQIDFTGIATGIYQPTMGALLARRAVQAVVAEYVAKGGVYRQLAVAPPAITGPRLAAIVSTTGEAITADRFVFACGSWLPKLFPEVVGRKIVPIKKDVFYFAPAAGDTRFLAGRLPAFVDVSSDDLHYGFPDIESRGFKIALDRHGPVVDPDTDDRVITAKALADVRVYLRRRFPDLADRPLAMSEVCQYENSDDGNFLIDRHPAAANVWIAGGGSGHGFKHGPAIGRTVAGMIAGKIIPDPRLALAAHHDHAG